MQQHRRTVCFALLLVLGGTFYALPKSTIPDIEKGDWLGTPPLHVARFRALGTSHVKPAVAKALYLIAPEQNDGGCIAAYHAGMDYLDRLGPLAIPDLVKVERPRYYKPVRFDWLYLPPCKEFESVAAVQDWWESNQELTLIDWTVDSLNSPKIEEVRAAARQARFFPCEAAVPDLERIAAGGDTEAAIAAWCALFRNLDDDGLKRASESRLAQSPNLVREIGESIAGSHAVRADLEKLKSNDLMEHYYLMSRLRIGYLRHAEARQAIVDILQSLETGPLAVHYANLVLRGVAREFFKYVPAPDPERERPRKDVEDYRGQIHRDWTLWWSNARIVYAIGDSR